LTALLRWCAFSFCLMRLICDLMFATRKDPHSLSIKVFGGASPAAVGAQTATGGKTTAR
jgi:hypothetical protein